MASSYDQTKTLTRDYHSYCQNRLHILDVMLARRSWRRYREWNIDPDVFSKIETFMKHSKTLRNCPEDDILLFTDQDRLHELFRAAYQGFIGKINPWLPKVKSAGAMILSIDKKARDEERPIAYAFPTFVGEDTILYITEEGLGSVWLAGINSAEVSKVIGLPPNKWVPVIIVFGKTDTKPIGINLDNMIYKTLSSRRKKLEKIVYCNYYNNSFNIPQSLPQPLKGNLTLSITNSLESLTKWEGKNQQREISQIEWELLAESARIAPSAGNSQRWNFILIQDKTLLSELQEILVESQPFSGVIAGIGVSGTLLEASIERPFWMLDLPIALSHISLMAGSLGLAARVYMDIPESRINSLLKVSSNWRTVGLVGLR